MKLSAAAAFDSKNSGSRWTLAWMLGVCVAKTWLTNAGKKTKECAKTKKRMRETLPEFLPVFSSLFFFSCRMKSLFSRSVHQNSIWLLREVEGKLGWVGLGGERLFFPRLLCSSRSELERETPQ